MTPRDPEKKKAYDKEYRKRPYVETKRKSPKRKAYHKAYQQRPERKAKMKEYFKRPAGL